ncbi:MAG: amidohydrolase [Candidatus Aminicenantes bacterium]|jgi:predicted amidohydrolase YtcJ
MRYLKPLILLVIFCFCAIILSCGKPGPADLVLYGGKIATVDEEFSIQEAVAVRGNKIVFVGSDDEVQDFIYPNTVVLDCKGKLVLPGLIDAHAHLHSLGEELTSLNVTGTQSFEEIIGRVSKRVESSKPGEWIVGGRWDQNDWEDTSFPVHDALSAVSPENPVYLTRIDGNAAFANAIALELADITKDTPDPFGGVIVRKPDGEPTGVLVNRAMNAVIAKIPENTEAQFREKFLKAVNACLRVGLTGVHEAGVGPRAISMYKDLIDRRQLKLRLYAMLGEERDLPQDIDLVEYFKSHRIPEYGDHMLSVRSIKLFFDGALGSRGAAFFEPYADDPSNTGLLRIPTDYIYEISKAALASDMGVNTHCIGIRGNSLCLDAYERAFKENPKEDHRFRIEHAQIVRPEDIRRFAALGVIPAMQPTHCTSDMYFVADRVGDKRAEGAYAWRWFIDAGLKIPCGSDFPVESTDPLLGIFAAVTRQDTSGWPEGGWYPSQRMTIQEAIKGFTIWAAYGAFQEDVLGSIEVGKYADFTILDKDILESDPAEILNTKPVYTIVAGKIRFRAE